MGIEPLVPIAKNFLKGLEKIKPQELKMPKITVPKSLTGPSADVYVKSAEKSALDAAIYKPSAVFTTISKESEYKFAKSNIKAESKKIIMTVLDSVNDKINPINAGNIGHIQNELKYFLKDTDLALPQETLNNPKKLFNFVKENLDTLIDGANQEKLCELLDEASKTGVTQAIQKEFNMLSCKALRRIRKFVNLLTPKSTNPKVLKLEEEVRALGVKDVNFSDDLRQAKLTKEAIEDMRKVQIPLPHSITVTSILPSDTNGMTASASSKLKTNGYVFLQKTKEKQFSDLGLKFIDKLTKKTPTYNKLSSDLQERYLQEINSKMYKFTSTNNPKHDIYHETAHTFQPNTIESILKTLTDKELKTASEISSYSTDLENGREAMPEIFAKLMDRQTLTPEQIDLYLDLGGIVPKF